MECLKNMQVTFLGTGTSHGVPSLDCMIRGFEFCPAGVCRKAAHDSRHARTRSSVLVRWGTSTVLIDVSADFRQQALRENIKTIDAVLLTHAHADHIGGIPDIRSYAKQPDTPLPFYGSAETVGNIRETFPYIFDGKTFVGGGIPHIKMEEVQKSFHLFGKEILPIHVTHGALKGCFGYRIGPLVYIPDMKYIEPDQEQMLFGVDTLVLNCLRIEREHSTHLILPQSMELARRIRPRQCFFIHMCHDIDYEIDTQLLDPWMHFACDGQQVTIE
jgi:phosphoribosyl 1,2-cyclic phosphate phosphodiesterase